ncbi:alpha/beta hydrolase [Streptomyces sp. NPDC051917]|uniref:alpha/beta fold hydrolase n=1 Tax=Streptomyces sp. NPDC051917 TaxID=3154754 RepID=UPI00344CAA68
MLHRRRSLRPALFAAGGVAAVGLGFLVVPLASASTSPSAPVATTSAETPSTQADSTGDHSSAKPTIVLVHGAWGDASGWSKVVKELQADGYTVAAPPDQLRGLSSDAAYLADYLKTITGPIVLVGHSYGGAVITDAATGNPNVKALAYIAAFAPDAGESANDLAAKFPGSHITDDPTAQIPTALNAVPFTQAGGGTGVDLYIKPDKFNDLFLSNRVSTRTAAELAAAQRPIAPQAVGEPSGTPAWKTVPSWYLVATDDNLIPPATERFMAQRAHAHTVEVNAPHAAMITNPDAVTSLILDAAQAG